jgi:hypothetical protein
MPPTGYVIESPVITAGAARQPDGMFLAAGTDSTLIPSQGQTELP